jgi:hypothetical protein
MTDPAEVASRFRKAWASSSPRDPTFEASTLPADPPDTPEVGTTQQPALARQTEARGPRRRRWLPPSSPTDRAAEPVDPPPTLYRCPHCGERHQTLDLTAGGMAALYGRELGGPYRSTVGDTVSLVRDNFSPWR